jgi:anti-anti-sigma regulatory factor
LTIAEVANERERFAACLVGAAELTLDAGELEAIDGAGLQLLAALVKTCREDGAAVRWRHVPDVLVRNAAALGVAEALELPPAEDRGETP